MPETTSGQISSLQEEYAKNPDARLFVHLAEAYRQSGELTKARDLLQEGIEEHRDSLSARIVLAEVLTELGEDESARSAWQEVLQLDEENETALRTLAELEERAGDAPRALEHLRRLIALGVDDRSVLETVARLDRSTQAAPPPAQRVAAQVAPPAESLTEAPSEPQPEPQVTPQPEARVIPQRERDESRPTSERSALGLSGAFSRPSAPETTAPADVIGVCDLLVRLLEYRDSTFNAQSSLTRTLALAIGRELELEQSHLDALALAALLSDLGGLAAGSPQAQTPRAGEESDDRRGAEQREVAISVQLLSGIALPAGVHEAIRHQHERWDGTGHPEGLRDEDIPYEARILAVARSCAAMLSHRPGHPAKTVAGALDELQRNAGSHYDPVIVNVLRRVFQRRAEHGVGYGLGGRVLIVHTNEMRALALATQLHSAGYVTEVTPLTTQARERIRSTPTRALVLGADLPRHEIGRFVQEVRASQAIASVPVVVLDADAMDQRVDLLTAGADVCFPSDVTFREFRATLDALLRRTEPAGLQPESAANGAQSLA